MPPLLPKKTDSKPDIRLATGVGPPDAFEKGMRKPDVRLAHGPGAQGDNVLIGRNGVQALPDTSLPGLLVSFWYLKQFQANRHRYHYRDWVMDSGAYSAHNSGAVVDLQQYIDCCLSLMATDRTLVEIYSLDVIGDWKGSLKNTEQMWKQGVPAIPCFHVGEPWDALVAMARDYPKIAFGGVAQIGSKKAISWAGQCFARVWPKKVHGFALCNERAIMALPFHSVDSTSWEIGPCKFGNWRAFGGQRVSVRGSKQNLRVEVEYYLDLEARARVRWKKEMAILEQLSPSVPLQSLPTVRLAGKFCEGNHEPQGQPVSEITGPTIRLAESGPGGRTEAKSEAFKKGN